jgi:hypothetical protein
MKLLSVMCCVLAGCSVGDAPDTTAVRAQSHQTNKSAAFVAAIQARPSAIAGAADKGALFSYESGQIQKGEVTWRPIALSEEHALKATVGAPMVLTAPDGEQVRLRYRDHIEHADGNWTWVGADAKGQQAVITFGEKAAFGLVPRGDGTSMEITSVGGRAYVVEGSDKLGEPKGVSDTLTASSVADAGAKARDALLAAGMPATPSPGDAKMSSQTGQVASASGPSGLTTIDLLIGYTTGFATRLGGDSEALTRVTFMVDIANQAYADSQVQGRLRLVGAMAVDYPDATLNRDALEELTGVNCVNSPGGQLPDRGVTCSSAARPAALQALAIARADLGADVVSLVRMFSSPENGACGYAWMLGNTQTAIDPVRDAAFGYSVVNDSSGTMFPDGGATCRHDTLAHELGHLTGLQHDVPTAQGADDTNNDGTLLDPEEFGRFADSFGYRTDSTQGNFATTMANRLAGQGSYRVFANPRITTCGGFACGQVGVADQAATLMRTMPVVEAFAPSRTLTSNNWLQGDFDGDGKADLLWHNVTIGSNVYWRAGNYQQRRGLASNGDIAWWIVGVGDFNGDNRSDILWRNRSTGANIYWKGGDATTRQSVATLADLAWAVSGVADFDGDNRDDILWRNENTGVNTIWRSASSSVRINVRTLGKPWIVGGIGDFDRDGKADIFWRNPVNGANAIWKQGNSSLLVASQTSVQWMVAGVGDINGDGFSDVIWRNTVSGANLVWWSGNPLTRKALTTLADTKWSIVGVGDFNNDGKDDLVWRNSVTGANTIWLSGDAATQQALPALGLIWVPA